MKKSLTIVLLLFCLSLTTQAQHRHVERRVVSTHSVRQDTIINAADSSRMLIGTAVTPEIDYTQWRPDPMKAVWLGALVPGLGQIYNRSYWKLPIVYGGFVGCAYAISWNAERYSVYREAYRDLYMDRQNNCVTDDRSRSYNQLLREGYTIDRMGGVDTYTSTLNNWQNNYHRYRDLSIAITAVYYALTLVDAFVDAQLFDFDISDDLTLNINPQLYYDPQYRQRAAEVRLAISF